MSAAGDSQFDIGRVVSRTFSVFGRNWISFLILSVLAVAPQMVWTFYFSRGLVSGGGINPAMSGSYWLILLAGWLVSTVLRFVLQAALTYGTIMDLNGQRASLGQALSLGLKAFLPVFAIGLLYSFGLGLGLVLLVVPGLMLLTAWAVVIPAFIAENTGVMGSFSRSSALTKGHRWSIFGIFVVFGIAVSILQFGSRPLFGLTMSTSSLAAAPAYLVLSGALNVITAVISAVGVACIYYELRTVKEGVGPQQLAAIFE